MSKKKKNTERVEITEEDENKFAHLKEFYKLKRVEIGPSGDKNYYLNCLLCVKNSEKSCSASSISNLERHYKSTHPNVKSKFDKAYHIKATKRSQEDESPSTSNQPKIQKSFGIFGFRPNCTQAQLNDAIIDFVNDTLQPFSMPEKESFREMIKLIDPTKTTPCFNTTVKLVDQQFQNMKENLLKELAKALFVSISTDAWNGNHKNYCGYTATWFDENMERNHAVIAVRRLIGSHNFAVVREEIVGILKEFK